MSNEHRCHEECECQSIDFALDHKAIARYVKERFGELPLTVIRRPQRIDPRTQLYSVRRDCEGWMRYRFDHDGNIMQIRIMLVSAEEDLDNPGRMIPKTVKQTLRTLAHELEHVQHLVTLGPAELKQAYKRQREAFEEEAKKAEEKWADLAHLVKPRKNKETHEPSNAHTNSCTG